MESVSLTDGLNNAYTQNCETSESSIVIDKSTQSWDARNLEGSDVEAGGRKICEQN